MTDNIGRGTIRIRCRRTLCGDGPRVFGTHRLEIVGVWPDDDPEISVQRAKTTKIVASTFTHGPVHPVQMLAMALIILVQIEWLACAFVFSMVRSLRFSDPIVANTKSGNHGSPVA